MAAENRAMNANEAAAFKHWTDRVTAAPLPVLRDTHDAVAYWRGRMDRADAHVLADLALRDPLMSLRVLAAAGRRIAGRTGRPVDTVRAAIVFTGIDAFFADHADLPVMEDVLAAHPHTLHIAQALLERAHTAAALAAAFAIHRQDEAVEVLHQAALLHEAPRLILCCIAPELAAAIAERQRNDPPLMRARDVEQELLGVGFAPLVQRMMVVWCLPESLQDLAVGRSRHPGARAVTLAVRIAHHLASPQGWHHPALAEDLADLGVFLNLPHYGAEMLVRRVRC